MTLSVDELRSRADASLVGLWSMFCSALGGTVGGSSTCRFVASGLPLAGFNGAIVLGRVDDPAQVLDEATAFMDDRGVPFLVWVREGVDDRLVERALARGFALVGQPSAMALSPIGVVPDPPAGVTIEEVVDAARIDDLRTVLRQGFAMPDELLDRIATPATTMSDGFASIVIRSSGAAVAGAQIAVTGTTAAVFNVATVPEHRGRGLGTAATWAVIRAGTERGCDHIVLQARRAIVPVYQKMGFRDIGRYLQLASPNSQV